MIGTQFPNQPISYESIKGISCQRVLIALRILFGSPFELLRLPGRTLIPGSLRPGVCRGAHAVSPLLPWSDRDLFGGGLLFSLSARQRKLFTGDSLCPAERSKTTDAGFVARNFVGAGVVGLSLPSTLLTDLTKL